MKNFVLFFIIITTLLFINNTTIASNSKTTVINADTLQSDKINSKLSAKGNVQLTRDKYKVTADEVVYDNLQGKIFLKSKTKLKDIDNNNIFADEGVISSDMMYGEFKNAGIILKNGISIVSPSIIKENDDKYLIGKSDYYFCPNSNLNIDLPYEDIVKEIKRNKTQLFSISSKKSVIDKEQSKIFLNHVLLKFLEVPIFYIPYISTARPFSENISGLSSPSLNSSSNYGYSISLPYRFYTKNGSLLLIEPEIFEDGNFILGLDFSLKTQKNFYFETVFDYIYDNHKSRVFLNDYNKTEKEENVYKNNRFKFNLDFNGIYGNDIFYKADIQLICDNYLLRDYYNDYTKTLQSTFDIVKITKNSYLDFNIVNFQEIREETYSTEFNTIHTVPHINYYYNNNIYRGYSKQLKFNFSSNVRDIIAKNDDGYTNISVKPTLSYRQNVLGGFFKSNLSLSFDSYRYFRNSYNDSEQHRIIPELELEFVLPFYIFNNIFIKPKIQYFLSDTQDVNNINVDSYDSELTINNLFTNNRYSGYDLIEKGSRLNYGIESSIDTKIGSFNLLVGQAYKDKIDDKNPIINFEDNLSNILTHFYYNYDDIFVSFIDTINSKNYNQDRKELMVEGGINKLTFGASFVRLLNYTDSTNTNYNKEKQLNFNFSYSFTKKIFVDFEINNNLEYDKITLLRTGIRYEDECFRIQAGIKKTDYIDSSNDSSTSFNLSFRLKGSQW